MRVAYAQVPSGLIHYAEAGSGEPLLLLHATPRSHRYFRHALERFAPRFRAIAVDTPGFGNSHPLPALASIRSIAECFMQFLDALGIERAHFFGLHTGNKIVAALAAEWPSRIASAVLAGQTHSLILDKGGRDEAIRQIVDHYFPQYGETSDGAHLVRRWAAVHAEVQSSIVGDHRNRFSKLPLHVEATRQLDGVAGAEWMPQEQRTCVLGDLRSHLYHRESGYVAEEGGKHLVALLNRERRLTRTAHNARRDLHLGKPAGRGCA